MHVVCVAGARPNFPKLKPVIDALERKQVRTTFVHTGQHYDAQMSEVFLEELGIRSPDHFLGVGSGSHAEQTARIMQKFEPLVDQLRPDIVVVIGDVNSTVACGLVAAKSGCRLAHVEAGLRSRDWDMPEEVNRVVTDRLSDYLLAPSGDAVENLRGEGYREDQIFLVGNVMIDTLLANRDRASTRLPQLRRTFGLGARPFVLATLHRPSNVDDPDQLIRLMGALETISRDTAVLFPVHPRTRKSLELARWKSPENLVLTDPLGYLDFIALEADSTAVITDSGGIQEETTALGVPCITVRESTERPITVTHGTNVVVGTDPDRVVVEAVRVISEGVLKRCPDLWDGHAGERIADVLIADANRARRPSSL